MGLNDFYNFKLQYVNCFVKKKDINNTKKEERIIY